MYAVIRRWKLASGASDEVISEVKEGWLPALSAAPGFVSYFILKEGEDTVTTISVFETRAQAEASNWLAADYRNKRMSRLAPNPPEVMMGEVKAVQEARKRSRAA